MNDLCQRHLCKHARWVHDEPSPDGTPRCRRCMCKKFVEREDRPKAV